LVGFGDQGWWVGCGTPEESKQLPNILTVNATKTGHQSIHIGTVEQTPEKCISNNQVQGQVP